MSKSFIEQSKIEWSNGLGMQEGNLEGVRVGCLQRIAKSLENMEGNYAQLISDRNFYQRRFKEEQACNERMARSIASLKGVITKLKKKPS